MEFPAEFLNALKNAESVLFFTGVGISAESGVPTFRGKEGLWKNYRPEELATLNAFLENPDRVWEWYEYRRGIVRKAKPNAAHLAIVEFEKYFREVVVVTQNVDDLHNRAGSREVYELHGNIEKNFCLRCGKRYDAKEFNDSEHAPHCPGCGGLVRPAVVWFGEALPADVMKSAEEAAKQCDVCFVVGTSAVVYPAAYIPFTAKSSGAFVVEVNIQPTEFTPYANLSLTGKAGEILPEVLRKLKEVR